jgi:hypothetical protein
MKIGFIQTGAIGDILIAIPAAKWYVDRGYDVFWPIDYRYIDFFKYAAPYVNFIEVPKNLSSFDWHLGYPKSALKELEIKELFTLYSYLGSNGQRFDFGQPKFLTESLKFDEYKYAITQVPFNEKWKLCLKRNLTSESKILDLISAQIPYALVHNAPSGTGREVINAIDQSLNLRIVKIQEITKSPFDWIGAYENATVIACEDSVHANLIEQLNINVKKFLFLRSPCSHTPVFKNNWIFQ